MILLITNKQDITTDFVVNKLNAVGREYYRFNTEELSLSINIHLDLVHKRYILTDNRKGIDIDLGKVRSVYYRRPELPDYHGLSLGEGERQFLSNELFYTLEGVYKILKDRFWISPVFAIREAENKIHQLIIAQELGFIVPPSIISNVPHEAKRFVNQYANQCIIKPIKTGLIKDKYNPQLIFTNLLEPKHIAELDRITDCPMYFQQNIKKQADVRVTVVGNRVFTAKIESQSFEETEIDWRKGENVNLEYSQITLPLELEQKCIQLTKSLNLNFGAIDFILDLNGEFIFLEINPNGQWGWIERKLNVKICDEIVALLTKGGL